MLGSPKSRHLDRPVIASLESLIPNDHFYRHLDAVLDLSFVREWVADLYAPIGRPSFDPEVFFRFHLIMFFEGIRSERKLVELASLNLAHRWYLGYNLDELFDDGHAAVENPEGDAGSTPRSATEMPPLLHPEGVTGELEGLLRRWDVLEECRLDPDRPAPSSYERLSSRKVSRTDPDATAMSLRDGRTALGYQVHYLADGGKARIILHCLVTPGDVMENQPFLDQFRRTVFRRKLRPRRVIADTNYGTAEIIGAIESQGIQMYTPLPDWDRPDPYFPTSRFTYDAERDVYLCPQGEILRLRWTDEKRQLKQYRARPAACKACPLRAHGL